jgi:PAS domain-containing protein
VGFFNGLELTVFQGQKEIHLLCYGFDRTNIALIHAVTAASEAQLRNSPTYSMTPKKDLPEMIEAIHQAGGIVLLAHPLATEPDVAVLDRLVATLVPAGLDGLEIYHPLLSSEQQAFLRELARSKGLVVSGGTDHHAPPPAGGGGLGIDLPMGEWKNFRDLLLLQRKKVRPAIESPNLTHPPSPIKPGRGRMRLLMGMVLPALAAVFLFTLALFGFFLPGYEKALMDRKREMIRELTRTVWSLLDEAEKQVQADRLSTAEAQNQVIERVRSLRYGREGKDYFWLQDLSPRMIMHPYRKDLEGQDLSAFVDARKIHIFTVFADKIRQDKEGYVDYVWQWKDDPSRLEAKESYIRLFEPWGWVIGTGLYIQDVVVEIHALKLRLIYAMGGIITVLILLLLVMLQGGWRSDRLRASAERRLQESHERYLTLVQAAAEGVLFVRNHRCAYANPVFLELAGCSAEELTLFDWQDLFPEISEQDPFFRETGAEVYTDALLRRRDGTDLKCRIAHKGRPGNGGSGFVVLVRRSEDTGIRSIAAAEGLLKRLLNVPAATAEDIAREIATAATAQEVVDLCRRSPELVRAMLESGSPPVAIAGMISSITDSATIRFIEFAQAELGSPPVAFAFIALGSQGRKEQTLFTDQDNAIVYDTPPPDLETRAENYFAALAERVCETLTQSGYRDCKGLVMAHNPKWRQPVAVWKDYFKNWISKAEAHEMMEFGTFFDMRCVYGDAHLIQILQTHLQKELSPAPIFFTQAAGNALLFKSPLRLFGNLVATGGSKEKAGHLDLKTAMMPIVSFARLYALQKNILFTSTQDRLSALTDQGVLLPSQYHDLLAAFETLLRLRLRHQSATIQKGGAPDNLIDPTWLGHIDKAVLKECFKEIDRMQERISRDFLGGESSL